MNHRTHALTGGLLAASLLLSTTVFADTPSPAHGLALTGTLEIEASGTREDDQGRTGDITLSTLALGIDAQPSDIITAHAVIVWEEDEDNGVNLDEAFISLGDGPATPYFLKAGRWVMPFGNFTTRMISDPLTLELGETTESAVQIGTTWGDLTVTAYSFKGDLVEKGDDERPTTFGFSAAYAHDGDGFALEIGAGFVSSILDSDLLQDRFTVRRDEHLETFGGGAFDLIDARPGYAVNTLLTIGPFTLTSEYLGSTSDATYETDDGNGGVSRFREKAFSAVHVEGGLDFVFLDRLLTAALACQKTRNLGGVLPEKRFGAALSAELAEGLTLGGEIIQDQDYRSARGGSGHDAETITVRLSLAF